MQHWKQQLATLSDDADLARFLTEERAALMETWSPAEGGRAWILYHAYDARAAGVPKLQVRPIAWGPDGWPVVGAPLF